MSVKTTTQVWEWSKAEGNARLVMLALADFCDDEGVCYPGVKRVAFKCRLSERTVQRVFDYCENDLKELVREQGEGLKVMGQRGEGYTTRYTLILKRGCQVVTPNDERKGVTETPKGGDIAVSPKPPEEPPVVNTEGGEKKKKRKRVSDTVSAEDLRGYILPPSLEDANFHAVFEDWRIHMISKKRTLVRVSLRHLIEDCVKWGPEKGAAYIRYAIRSGWSSVHENFKALTVDGKSAEARVEKDRANTFTIDRDKFTTLNQQALDKANQQSEELKSDAETEDTEFDV